MLTNFLLFLSFWFYVVRLPTAKEIFKVKNKRQKGAKV
jgi:hypothetical protein